MTDREKLMDLIIQAKRTDPETGSFTEYLADFLLGYGVRLPALAQSNGWRNVKERLPKSGTVLATDGRIVITAPSSSVTKDGAAITHWMPLPAPPDSRPPEGEA